MSDAFSAIGPKPANLGTMQTFENMHIPLFILFADIVQGGENVIRGRTFTNCVLAGPAVIAPTGAGVNMRDCDMGNASGNIRNLLLRPMGSLVTGAIPFDDCTFIGCKFRSIGFAGSDEFLKQFVANIGAHS